MSENIYVPRPVVDMLLQLPQQKNKCVCVKFPHKGYEISLSMDSSHGPGDLFRSDIRVFLGDREVTTDIFPKSTCEDGSASTVYGDVDNLRAAFSKIDEIVAS